MKYYDQHIHSSFSKDSEEDLENYFIKAKENGIEYVITCEHFDPHTSVDGTSWDADYDALIAYQKKLKKKYPMITPLLGIELGYRKEYMDGMEEKEDGRFIADIIYGEHFKVKDFENWSLRMRKKMKEKMLEQELEFL